MYRIEILTEPEIFNGKPMFFWMIQKEVDGNRSNCGHGWSESIPKAAEDAEKHYRDVVK